MLNLTLSLAYSHPMARAT